MSEQEPFVRPRLEAPQKPEPAAQQPGPPADEPLYTYKPQGTLVTALMLFFITLFILDFAYGLVNLIYATLLSNLDARVEAGDPVAVVFVIAYFLIVVGYMIGIIVTAVLYCVWVYGANRNARALGAKGMTYTPGWCVGWFFIPFANLFKPFKAVSEIYKASDPGADSTSWMQSPGSIVLSIWWTCWIVSTMLGQLENRLGASSDPESLEASMWLAVIIAPVCMASAYFAATVVRKIHVRQKEKAKLIALKAINKPFTG